jgi:hypothetical protein
MKKLCVASLLAILLLGCDKPVGDQRAQEWAAKFGAEGPLECRRTVGYTYECTVVRNKQIIALECYQRGCSVVNR